MEEARAGQQYSQGTAGQAGASIVPPFTQTCCDFIIDVRSWPEIPASQVPDQV